MLSVHAKLRIDLWPPLTRGLSAQRTGGEILILSSFKSGRKIGFSPSVAFGDTSLVRGRRWCMRYYRMRGGFLLAAGLPNMGYL